MLWHLPLLVLQERIQEVPTPSSRGGSHSTQNHPNFPQGLLPWWHWWGKWGREGNSFLSAWLSIFFLKSQKRLMLALIQKNSAFPEDSGPKPEQCKENPSLSTLTSSGGWFTAIHLFSRRGWYAGIHWKLYNMIPARGSLGGFITIHSLRGSQALATSYLHPRPTDIVHPTVPSRVPWRLSLKTRQGTVASKQLKLFFLTWDDTEIMIPALRNLSLSILRANKAANYNISMPEQIYMSLQILALISPPVRLAPLSPLVPLGTTKFLCFQVGLCMIAHPQEEKDDSSPADVCPGLSIIERWKNCWDLSSHWAFFTTWPAISFMHKHLCKNQ